MEEMVKELFNMVENLAEKHNQLARLMFDVLSTYDSMADEDAFRSKWQSKYDEIASLFPDSDGLGNLYSKHLMYKNQGNFEELFGHPYDENAYVEQCFSEAHAALSKLQSQAETGDAHEELAKIEEALDTAEQVIEESPTHPSKELDPEDPEDSATVDDEDGLVDDNEDHTTRQIYG